METELLFSGKVRIHLQGKNALLPFGTSAQNEMGYHLGAENTALLILDHRTEPVQAANLALQTGDISLFPAVFNQPAWVAINQERETIRISLYEGDAGETDPILWMGVLENNQIPIRYMFWEKFVGMETDEIAFAAIIED